MLILKKSGPSESQLDAGNYKKGHRWFRNMRVTIENAKGTARKWHDADGSEGETKMQFDYGYIRGTHSTGDGEHVDCYIGPNEEADTVYIVDQAKVGQWEKYDEQKVMLGFDSEEAARAAYLAHYTDPRFLMKVRAMPLEEFRDKAHATLDKPAMIKAIFLKTHVAAYTKKDGTVVAPHEDRRAAAQRLADKIRAHGPEFEPHVEEASGGSVYVTVHRHTMTAAGKRHAKKQPQAMDYKARFADHGSYWGSTISVDPVTGNTEDDAMAMFEHAADPKSKPRITSFNRSQIAPGDRTQYVAKVTYNENVHKNGGKDYWREGPRERAADMTKSTAPIILFFKGYVGPYLRGGKIVNARGYQGRSAQAHAAPGQMSLFGGPESGKPLPPSPLKGKDPVAHTPDMFGDSDQKKRAPSQVQDKDKGKAFILGLANEQRKKRESLVAGVKEIYEAGNRLPVLQSGSLLYVVHPATRSPGKIQVTTYNKTGAIGDTLINTIEDLPSAIGTTSAQLLSEKDADEALSSAALAEGNYQSAKAKAKATDTVTEPRAEMVKEHERLVGVLNSPSHADDKAEAKKQAAELKEYKDGGDNDRIDRSKPDLGLTDAQKDEVRRSGASWAKYSQHRLNRVGHKEAMEMAGGTASKKQADKPDPTAELRALWTKQGVSKERQDQLLGQIGDKAKPGAKVGPFTVGGPNATYNAAVTSTQEGPADDNPRRKFYVTIARAGKGVGKLAGPFDTHDEAKGHVDRARKLAEEADPRAAFDAFGTVGVEADEHKPGVLNERLGIGQKPMTKSIVFVRRPAS